MNSKLLGSAVASANKKNKNVYMLGHTHPKIPEDKKSKTLPGQISKEVKETYGIKEPGLNVSLQDLYQLVYFQEAVKSWVKEDSKIYLTLLMYDGTMEAISIEDGKVKKTSILYK